MQIIFLNITCPTLIQVVFTFYRVSIYAYLGHFRSMTSNDPLWPLTPYLWGDMWPLILASLCLHAITINNSTSSCTELTDFSHKCQWSVNEGRTGLVTSLTSSIYIPLLSVLIDDSKQGHVCRQGESPTQYGPHRLIIANHEKSQKEAETGTDKNTDIQQKKLECRQHQNQIIYIYITGSTSTKIFS